MYKVFSNGELIADEEKLSTALCLMHGKAWEAMQAPQQREFVVEVRTTVKRKEGQTETEVEVVVGEVRRIVKPAKAQKAVAATAVA